MITRKEEGVHLGLKYEHKIIEQPLKTFCFCDLKFNVIDNIPILDSYHIFGNALSVQRGYINL